MNLKFIHLRGIICIMMLLGLGVKSNAQTYCTPTYNYGCDDDYMQSFSTTGGVTNISNLNSGSSAATACISNQTSMLHTTTAGATVNFTIVNNPGWSEGYKIFVDWNEDGDFTDPGEIVYDPTTTLSSGATATGSFTVPASTTAGSKRMRVRCSYSSTVFDGCSTADYGEIEDYTLLVTPSTPCTNPPTAGTVATSVPDSICPNISFALASTGTALGGGMTYQWEQSPTGAAGSWTDVTGATNITYTLTSGITASTYFRLKVICSGGTPVYTNAKQVLLKNFMNCFCTPTYSYGCTYGGTIDGFATSGAQVDISNLNTGCASGGAGYSDYTSMAISAVQSLPFTCTVNISAYETGVKIWADWNHDGTFDPVTELCAESANTIPAGSSFNGLIIPPVTALTGPTRIRVRGVEGSTSFGPCASAYYGEAEDYTINIIALPPCTNPPTPGTIAASVPDSICPNIPFALNTTSTSYGSGMVYQWEQSPTGAAGSWTDVTGANTVYYMMTAGINTAAYYRLKTSCSGGTPVYSNAKHITIKNFINCYCTPTYTYGCTYGGTIDGFATTGAMIDVSNLSTGCASGALGYSDYTSMAVTAAHSFGFDFAVNIASYSTGVRIWADWNHDGVFDPVTELCAASPNTIPAGSAFTGTIIPPATALTGPTRIRVRGVEGSTSFDPCPDYYYGETEDYTIIIINPPACSTITLPVIHSVTSPNFLCLNGNSTLGININMPPATGFTYQWQRATAAAGPWTNIGSPLTTVTLPVTGITSTTYYRMQILCDGTLVQTTSVDSVVVGDPGSITATDGQRCGDGSVVIGATPAIASSQVLWYEAATGGNSIGAGATFNTPSLTATTTFYAAASAGTSVYNTGKPTPTSTSGNSGFNDVGLMFNALAPFTLESVNVYPMGTSPSGAVTIALKDAAGTTLQSATASVNVSANGTMNVVPLNFSVPAGTGYRLVVVATSGITNLVREYATGFSYPYTVAGVSSITSAYSGGATSDYYYYLYKWVVKTSCESVRVPVVATVNPVPMPDLGPDVNTCVDQGTTITLDPGTIPNSPVFTWDNGAVTPTRTVGQSGIYHVAVNNSYGCIGRDTVEVRLKWNPVVDLEAGGTGLCLGGTRILDAGPGGQNGGTYYWNNGATTRTISISGEGTYVVYVTSNEGCLTIDTVKIIATGYMPIVDGIVTQPTAASSFSFSAVNPQNVTSFKWNFGDGSAPVTVSASASSTGQTTHTYPAGGNYNVSLTTYSTCGDVLDSTMVSIIGTGLNDVDQVGKLVQVYPNPNDGTIAYIKIDDVSVKLQSLAIYNVMGQEIMQVPSFEQHNGIYKVVLPEHLAGGMYTLRIQTSKGHTTKKLNVVK